jgi:hypothetical protein
LRTSAAVLIARLTAGERNAQKPGCAHSGPVHGTNLAPLLLICFQCYLYEEIRYETDWTFEHATTNAAGKYAAASRKYCAAAVPHITLSGGARPAPQTLFDGSFKADV